jgi:hypothetical protein
MALLTCFPLPLNLIRFSRMLKRKTSTRAADNKALLAPLQKLMFCIGSNKNEHYSPETIILILYPASITVPGYNILSRATTCWKARLVRTLLVEEEVGT